MVIFLIGKIRRLINKISKIIDKMNGLENKYKITSISAASSFYIIIALFSIIFLVYQIYGLYSKDIEDFLLSKVLDIINPVYHSIISENLSGFSFSSFSVLLFFNLLWSGSKIINNLNNIADNIYVNVKRRKGYLKRISAFFMFMMLVLISFFLIAFIVYTNNLILNLFDNMLILRVVQFIIEISTLFFIILLIYIYSPPIKMNISDVFLGTVIATSGIYILIILFLLIFSLLNFFSITLTIITIISTSFLIIYLINIVLNLGLIINYHKNKFGRIL